LQKMWRLLRPGGRLVITTWGPGVFEPHGRVFWNAVGEVRPELYKSADSWERLNSPELLRAAFEQADIEEERREHTLQTPADWWTMMMGSGHRATIEQLTPEEQAHVRAACLAITATTIPIPVLYAVASR